MASSQKMLLTPSSLLNLKPIPELHCHDFEHESIWNESIHTLQAIGFYHFTEPDDGEFSRCSSAVREEEELISAMDQEFAEESAEKESMNEYVDELISAMDEAFAEESAEKESMDEYFAEACHQEREMIERESMDEYFAEACHQERELIEREHMENPQASKWKYERDSPAENPESVVAFCEVVDKFQKLREFGEEHTQLAIARAELSQQVFHSKEAVLSLIDSRIIRLRELMDRP